MRHSTRTLLIVLGLFAAVTSLAIAALPAGIVSWWPLDGNANDVQNGNPGVVVGAGTFEPGKVGLGFRSGGQGSLVEVADAPNLDLTTFTIAAWVRVDALNFFNMPIVWKGNNGGQDVTSPYSLVITGTNSGPGGPGATFVLLSDGANTQELASSSLLPLGTFTHIAATADGTNLRIYVDGQLDSEVAQNVTALVNNSFPLQIGGMSDAIHAAYFNGIVDEVQIYNRALTASEIESIAADVIPVVIDIKPGSFPNSINLGSGGNVPVAIFSSSTFDATTVDPTTVTLADAAVKVRGKGKPAASQEDVDGDGLLDLVVHIDTSLLNLTDGDVVADLNGQTLDGQAIHGSDTVRIVP